MKTNVKEANINYQRSNRLGAPSSKPADMMATFVNELKAQEDRNIPTYSYAQPNELNPIKRKRKPSVRAVGFMSGF